jgi:uncharacterized iron-regulated membrane protein
LSPGAIRIWRWVHKWTSLVCTLFLMMLCLTGMPLIFHAEIDAAMSDDPVIVQGEKPLLPLDQMLANALRDNPGSTPLFMSFDEDRPVVNVTTGPAADAVEGQMALNAYDRTTGEHVGLLSGGGLMDFILQLHTDMFLGLGGMLFLGAMGLLFTAAIVSGVVLYAPFMRRLPFGAVRVTKRAPTRWLDYHNLLGIVTTAWVLVVGLTGVINTLATPIFDAWRASDLSEMTAAYASAEPLGPERASLDVAVASALAAQPGRRIQFIAFPGGDFSSAHHYAVFLQGDTPLTKQLLTPALIDARTGELTAIRPLPWYAQALLISQPLHFGDYGGLPLKILWALLTVMTTVVLGSGVYLWLAKKR